MNAFWKYWVCNVFERFCCSLCITGRSKWRSAYEKQWCTLSHKNVERLITTPVAILVVQNSWLGDSACHLIFHSKYALFFSNKILKNERPSPLSESLLKNIQPLPLAGILNQRCQNVLKSGCGQPRISVKLTLYNVHFVYFYQKKSVLERIEVVWGLFFSSTSSFFVDSSQRNEFIFCASLRLHCFGSVMTTWPCRWRFDRKQVCPLWRPK